MTQPELDDLRRTAAYGSLTMIVPCRVMRELIAVYDATVALEQFYRKQGKAHPDDVRAVRDAVNAARPATDDEAGWRR